jgi:two-component system, chemotaxis family, protein-glutamate methylesterase/glutaminase
MSTNVGTPPSTHPVRIVLGAESHSRLFGLATYLEVDRALVVVACCQAYEEVLASVRRTSPDLVVVELDLLGTSVAVTASRVRRARPVRVVVLADAHQQRSERGCAALAAGAVMVVGGAAIDLDAPTTALARSFRRQFQHGAVAEPPMAGARSLRATRPQRATVIGICASTGGPQALAAVLSRIPAEFAIPVLVVQHMLSGFTEGMVSWLNEQVPAPIAIARDGQELEPGVWFAPDGSHLVVDAGRRLALDPGPPLAGHRPSGDKLLGSLAEIAGGGAVAVVLTGMGRDGAMGLAAVEAVGGRTIAQDEASSTVYGMPRAAADGGAAQVLSLAAIGDELASLAVGARR